jgi:hypothetical protein
MRPREPGLGLLLESVAFRLDAEAAGKRPVRIVAERVGINQATVFRGFCGHPIQPRNVLFWPIRG